jgi:hypothetical protein
MPAIALRRLGEQELHQDRPVISEDPDTSATEYLSGI